MKCGLGSSAPPPSLHVLSTHITLHSPFARVDGPWDTLRLIINEITAMRIALWSPIFWLPTGGIHYACHQSSDHGTLVGGEAPVHVSQATIMPEPSKARAVMNAESEEGRMDLTLRPGDAIIPGRIPDHRVQQPLSWLLAYDYYAATAIHWGPSRTAEKRASRLCCSLGVRVKPGSLQSAGSISWVIERHPTSCRRCILRCSQDDGFEPSESGFQGDANAAEYNRASRSATVRVECQRRVDSISRSNSWETLSGRTPTAATGSVIISRVAYAYGRPV